MSHTGRRGLNDEKYVAHMLLTSKKETAIIEGYVTRKEDSNVGLK